MKKIKTISLSLTCWLFAASFLPVFSKSPLSFSEKVTLFDHLVEVNEEWLRQPGLPAGLDCPASFRSDNERIAVHLRMVEQTLRKRPTNTLTTGQKSNRQRHLDVLREYWQRGLFPTNHYHLHRQPYFVDYFGVHCAVGYLIHRDGGDALVQKIRRENNYGYVAELAQRFPGIKDWAVRNGFTVAELALIQPAYGPKPQVWNQVGNGGGCNGRINVMRADVYDKKLYMAGNFTEIDGVEANSIVAWNGENWLPLGEGWLRPLRCGRFLFAG
jgi:hypothetical protein